MGPPACALHRYSTALLLTVSTLKIGTSRKPSRSADKLWAIRQAANLRFGWAWSAGARQSQIVDRESEGGKMVGAVRFELTTSCTRNKRASQATLRPDLRT
jgi:hypothetical protein